jgi:hypothetical protein
MDLSGALSQVFGLWRMVLPAMFLGCLVGNWIQGTRLWDACSRLIAPLVKAVRLPTNCGIYLAMCFINQFAANAYLGGELQKESLRKRELLASFLIGSFLTGLHFAIFYIAPILIGSVGWKVGISYVALYLLIGVMTAGVGIFIGWGTANRSTPKTETGSTHSSAEGTNQRSFVLVLREAWRQFRRMGLIFVPVTFVFALGMHHAQISQWVAATDRLLGIVGLSGPAIIVVLAGLPSSISGMAAAGSLYQSHLIRPTEVVSSLLIAYGLHSIYEFFASYLPSTIAFFGPKNGMHVSLSHLFIRLGSISLVLAFILYL